MLPPVFKVIEHMEGGDEILLRESMMLDTFFVFAYLFIGATILIPLFRKKES